MKAFYEAFLAGTEPHPFLKLQRVWRGRACFEAKVWDGKVWLDFIQALYPGEGDGSAALKWFLALADEHRVDIHGYVKRVGDRGLTASQLRAWYRRHGFKVKRNGDMVRVCPYLQKD